MSGINSNLATLSSTSALPGSQAKAAIVLPPQGGGIAGNATLGADSIKTVHDKRTQQYLIGQENLFDHDSAATAAFQRGDIAQGLAVAAENNDRHTLDVANRLIADGDLTATTTETKAPVPAAAAGFWSGPPAPMLPSSISGSPPAIPTFGTGVGTSIDTGIGAGGAINTSVTAQSAGASAVPIGSAGFNPL